MTVAGVTAAASPCASRASARRRPAGEQRGRAAPLAMRLSTLTRRAASAAPIPARTSATRRSRLAADTGGAGGPEAAGGRMKPEGAVRTRPERARPPGRGRGRRRHRWCGGGSRRRCGRGSGAARGRRRHQRRRRRATGAGGPAGGRRLADVAQHELEAADLALDVGGRRAARGVLARERQLVGLRMDGGEALAQVADDLAERFRELDIRADRAVEKLLGDGADVHTDLARVDRLRPLGLGDHDARGRGRRGRGRRGRGRGARRRGRGRRGAAEGPRAEGRASS